MVFDTKHASAAVRHLIGGKGAGYGCFRFEAPYHRDVPAELLFARQTLRGNAIRIFGLARPYDGCEVEGGYGHTWPDRNHSHSAVEIALTPRGRRYFADRAAARDLALLVRSHAMQKIRRLTGSALTSAIGTLQSDTAASASIKLTPSPGLLTSRLPARMRERIDLLPAWFGRPHQERARREDKRERDRVRVLTDL